MIVTSVFPDRQSTSTSTSTSTTCYTLTACTGSATTVSKTTSTITTLENVCAKSNCGAACARRRAIETGVPKYDMLGGPQTELDNINSTIARRQIPRPGTGDWSAWYGALKRSQGSVVIDNLVGVLGSNTAAEQIKFEADPRSIVLEGLHGCTAIIAVSHLGKHPNSSYTQLRQGMQLSSQMA